MKIKNKLILLVLVMPFCQALSTAVRRTTPLTRQAAQASCVARLQAGKVATLPVATAAIMRRPALQQTPGYARSIIPANNGSLRPSITPGIRQYTTAPVASPEERAEISAQWLKIYLTSNHEELRKKDIEDLEKGYGMLYVDRQKKILDLQNSTRLLIPVLENYINDLGGKHPELKEKAQQEVQADKNLLITLEAMRDKKFAPLQKRLGDLSSHDRHGLEMFRGTKGAIKDKIVNELGVSIDFLKPKSDLEQNITFKKEFPLGTPEYQAHVNRSLSALNDWQKQWVPHYKREIDRYAQKYPALDSYAAELLEDIQDITRTVDKALLEAEPLRQKIEELAPKPEPDVQEKIAAQVNVWKKYFGW